MTALDAPSGTGLTPISEKPTRRRRDWLSMTLVGSSIFWLALISLSALAASWLPIPNPYDAVGQPRIGPFQDWAQPLGTDSLGRSILSRSIYGARASLAIGMLSVSVGMLLGGLLGLLAGTVRGKVDAAIGVLTDSMLAFPGLVLLLAIATIMGPGTGTVIVGLGLIALPVFQRMTRANTLRFVEAEFVQAATLLGASRLRIIRREILPNVFPPMVAYAVIVMATLITAEAALSFLGLGLRPPAPSWGSAIADGQFELGTDPHLVFVPAAILALTVFSFNMLGDWVRTKLELGDSKI